MKIFNLNKVKTSFSLESVLVLAEDEKSAKIIVARNTFSNESDWIVNLVTETTSSPKIIHKYKIR